MLSETEKHFLLKVARSTVELTVHGIPIPEFETNNAALLRSCGAFVTLRIGDHLRGCIGYVDPIKALIETIREAASKAAREDLRFLPVSAEELPQIWIEISVLSLLSPLTSIEEIEIGRHGLVVESGRSRGLLLPQVAMEHQWDRETFLTQTARKAGLPPTVWKDGDARMYTFMAEIFSERSMAQV